VRLYLSFESDHEGILANFATMISAKPSTRKDCNLIYGTKLREHVFDQLGRIELVDIGNLYDIRRNVPD